MGLVVDALPPRTPERKLLPGDVRAPADQHHHSNDRRGARRARRPDRTGPRPQRRRLRQCQPRLPPRPLRRRERPGQLRGTTSRTDRDTRMARLSCPPVACARRQHRLDPRAGSRRWKRVRTGVRPAVRVAREHVARPIRGRSGRGSLAGARWRGSPAWSGAAEHSRSCSWPTTSTGPAQSSTAMSTGVSPTTSSTRW